VLVVMRVETPRRFCIYENEKYRTGEEKYYVEVKTQTQRARVIVTTL